MKYASSPRHFVPIFLAVFVVVSTFVSFQNCGGGGGGKGSGGTIVAAGPAGLGVFIDDPVAGLYYVTSSGLSGTTNSLGQFQYNPGDTVTFYAMGVKIGSTVPTIAADGSSNVTPLDLVPNNTGVTDPQVTTIAQFLNTLNAISGTQGGSQTGVFTMPSASPSSTASASTLTQSELQNILDSIFGSGTYTISSAQSSQNTLSTGVASQSVVGTLWRGYCNCADGGGGGTLFFNSGGSVEGFTDDGDLISGTWSSAASGVSFTVTGSNGGALKNGFIATGSSTGSGDIFKSDNTFNGTIVLTKVTSGSAVSASSYAGAWFATYTPNAYGISLGDSGGGSAYILVGPNVFYGILDDRKVISGSLDASGTGSAAFSDHGGTSVINASFATQSGNVTWGGNVKGSITLSRTGVFVPHPKDNGGSPGPDPTAGPTSTPNSNPTATPNGTSTPNNTATPVPTVTPTATSTPPPGFFPVLVHIKITWANTSHSIDTTGMTLNLRTSGGQILYHVTHNESSFGDHSGNQAMTEDDLAVSYTEGTVSTYDIDGGGCSVSGGSGSIGPDGTHYPDATIYCP